MQKLDSSGAFLLTFGSHGSGDGQFDSPCGVYADSSGTIYVADTMNDRVQKFSSTGAFLLKFGATGTGSGQFIGPLAITGDYRGNVYVTDRHGIQKFDHSGNFLLKFSATVPVTVTPTGIAADGGGDVYVCFASTDEATAATGSRISRFDQDGAFICDIASYGAGNGQVLLPKSLCIVNDTLYVSDVHRVGIFTRQGHSRPCQP